MFHSFLNKLKDNRLQRKQGIIYRILLIILNWHLEVIFYFISYSTYVLSVTNTPWDYFSVAVYKKKVEVHSKDKYRSDIKQHIIFLSDVKYRVSKEYFGIYSTPFTTKEYF